MKEFSQKLLLFPVTICALGIASCSTNSGESGNNNDSHSKESSVVSTVSMTAEPTTIQETEKNSATNSATHSASESQGNDASPDSWKNITPDQGDAFAAYHIYPEQKGYMFTTTRGDYCELHPTTKDNNEASALCRLDLPASGNALSINRQDGARVIQANRPLSAQPGVKTLQPGQYLELDGIRCGVTQDQEVKCQLDEHSFSFNQEAYHVE
ncbi:hypothetical protein GP475_05415 [Corynebacterium poyangense]|uniref:Uncharacterized protein n=1 Tax=Corynebacterium poyangense TaxID=2684405 RepID=A0A7H0SNL9_9CORY|nr:hypothetical protein [Corynebacterium poyangense]MBZ8177178.1 hypothetical protein [Corynebacterium poyangense]QNQ90144.1 hypothetical protein GP475_05415 [Corynebacterium poyangense]